MPIRIVWKRITEINCDVIVNASNSNLDRRHGFNPALYRSAGIQLLDECRRSHLCETDDVMQTNGNRKNCPSVIHAVGPIWYGGDHNEIEQLSSCYRRALELAKQKGFETIAFPLISVGASEYPKDIALKVAVDTISQFLKYNEMTVYISIIDKSDFKIDEGTYKAIEDYIDKNLYSSDDTPDVMYSSEPSEQFISYEELPDENLSDYEASLDEKAYEKLDESPLAAPSERAFRASLSRRNLSDSLGRSASYSLQEAIDRIDESFSEMLLRKIDESGMTDAECYKKANIDRKLFSKIRSNKLYKPSKPTAMAFAIALELSRDEAADLLMKAGFAFSKSSKFDIIVEYFIIHENYNIFEINEALFAFDQPLLGG